MFAPARCIRVTLAAFILHNICISRGLPLDEDVEECEDVDGGNVQDPGHDDILLGNDGKRIRDQLVRGRFARQ